MMVSQLISIYIYQIQVLGSYKVFPIFNPYQNLICPNRIWIQPSKNKNRYTILAPTAIPKGFVDAKVATEKVIGAIQLDENDHKFGHTKACHHFSPFHSQFHSTPTQIPQHLPFPFYCWRWCCLIRTQSNSFNFSWSFSNVEQL